MSGDILLKLDGIKGESKDKTHSGAIQVESVSWDVANATSFAHGDGGGVGKARLADIILTKKTDKSTQKLVMACATGDHIKSGVLIFRKAGKDPQEFLKFALTQVMVSSVSFGDDAGGDLPHETISLAFAKIEVEYREQGADGKLLPGSPVSYDVQKQEAA